MALQLYVDVHVPVSVTRALRAKSLDVLTSQEDGTAEFEDEALLVRAAMLGRVLLTQDTDFLRIAPEWQEAGRRFPGIVFARQGVPIGHLIADLELCLTCCGAEELRNSILHLPLKTG